MSGEKKTPAHAPSLVGPMTFTGAETAGLTADAAAAGGRSPALSTAVAAGMPPVAAEWHIGLCKASATGMTEKQQQLQLLVQLQERLEQQQQLLQQQARQLQALQQQVAIDAGAGAAVIVSPGAAADPAPWPSSSLSDAAVAEVPSAFLADSTGAAAAEGSTASVAASRRVADCSSLASPSPPYVPLSSGHRIPPISPSAASAPSTEHHRSNINSDPHILDGCCGRLRSAAVNMHTRAAAGLWPAGATRDAGGCGQHASPSVMSADSRWPQIFTAEPGTTPALNSADMSRANVASLGAPSAEKATGLAPAVVFPSSVDGSSRAVTDTADGRLLETKKSSGATSCGFQAFSDHVNIQHGTSTTSGTATALTAAPQEEQQQQYQQLVSVLIPAQAVRRHQYKPSLCRSSATLERLHEEESQQQTEKQQAEKQHQCSLDCCLESGMTSSIIRKGSSTPLGRSNSSSRRRGGGTTTQRESNSASSGDSTTRTTCSNCSSSSTTTENVEGGEAAIRGGYTSVFLPSESSGILCGDVSTAAAGTRVRESGAGPVRRHAAGVGDFAANAVAASSPSTRGDPAPTVTKAFGRNTHGDGGVEREPSVLFTHLLTSSPNSGNRTDLQSSKAASLGTSANSRPGGIDSKAAVIFADGTENTAALSLAGGIHNIAAVPHCTMLTSTARERKANINKATRRADSGFSAPETPRRSCFQDDTKPAFSETHGATASKKSVSSESGCSRSSSSTSNNNGGESVASDCIVSRSTTALQERSSLSLKANGAAQAEEEEDAAAVLRRSSSRPTATAAKCEGEDPMWEAACTSTPEGPLHPAPSFCSAVESFAPAPAKNSSTRHLSVTPETYSLQSPRSGSTIMPLAVHSRHATAAPTPRAKGRNKRRGDLSTPAAPRTTEDTPPASSRRKRLLVPVSGYNTSNTGETPDAQATALTAAGTATRVRAAATAVTASTGPDAASTIEAATAVTHAITTERTTGTRALPEVVTGGVAAAAGTTRERRQRALSNTSVAKGSTVVTPPTTSAREIATTYPATTSSVGGSAEVKATKAEATTIAAVTSAAPEGPPSAGAAAVTISAPDALAAAAAGVTIAAITGRAASEAARTVNVAGGTAEVAEVERPMFSEGEECDDETAVRTEGASLSADASVIHSSYCISRPSSISTSFASLHSRSSLGTGAGRVETLSRIPPQQQQQHQIMMIGAPDEHAQQQQHQHRHRRRGHSKCMRRRLTSRAGRREEEADTGSVTSSNRRRHCAAAAGEINDTANICRQLGQPLQQAHMTLFPLTLFGRELLQLPSWLVRKQKQRVRQEMKKKLRDLRALHKEQERLLMEQITRHQQIVYMRRQQWQRESDTCAGGRHGYNTDSDEDNEGEYTEEHTHDQETRYANAGGQREPQVSRRMRIEEEEHRHQQEGLRLQQQLRELHQRRERLSHFREMLREQPHRRHVQQQLLRLQQVRPLQAQQQQQQQQQSYEGHGAGSQDEEENTREEENGERGPHYEEHHYEQLLPAQRFRRHQEEEQQRQLESHSRKQQEPQRQPVRLVWQQQQQEPQRHTNGHERQQRQQQQEEQLQNQQQHPEDIMEVQLRLEEHQQHLEEYHKGPEIPQQMLIPRQQRYDSPEQQLMLERRCHECAQQERPRQQVHQQNSGDTISSSRVTPYIRMATEEIEQYRGNNMGIINTDTHVIGTVIVRGGGREEATPSGDMLVHSHNRIDTQRNDKEEEEGDSDVIEDGKEEKQDEEEVKFGQNEGERQHQEGKEVHHYEGKEETEEKAKEINKERVEHHDDGDDGDDYGNVGEEDAEGVEEGKTAIRNERRRGRQKEKEEQEEDEERHHNETEDDGDGGDDYTRRNNSNKEEEADDKEEVEKLANKDEEEDEEGSKEHGRKYERGRDIQQREGSNEALEEKEEEYTDDGEKTKQKRNSNERGEIVLDERRAPTQEDDDGNCDVIFLSVVCAPAATAVNSGSTAVEAQQQHGICGEQGSGEFAAGGGPVAAGRWQRGQTGEEEKKEKEREVLGGNTAEEIKLEARTERRNSERVPSVVACRRKSSACGARHRAEATVVTARAAEPHTVIIIQTDDDNNNNSYTNDDGDEDDVDSTTEEQCEGSRSGSVSAVSDIATRTGASQVAFIGNFSTNKHSNPFAVAYPTRAMNQAGTCAGAASRDGADAGCVSSGAAGDATFTRGDNSNKGSGGGRTERSASSNRDRRFNCDSHGEVSKRSNSSSKSSSNSNNSSGSSVSGNSSRSTSLKHLGGRRDTTEADSERFNGGVIRAHAEAAPEAAARTNNIREKDEGVQEHRGKIAGATARNRTDSLPEEEEEEAAAVKDEGYRERSTIESQRAAAVRAIRKRRRRGHALANEVKGSAQVKTETPRVFSNVADLHTIKNCLTGSTAATASTEYRKSMGQHSCTNAASVDSSEVQIISSEGSEGERKQSDIPTERSSLVRGSASAASIHDASTAVSVAADASVAAACVEIRNTTKPAADSNLQRQPQQQDHRERLVQRQHYQQRHRQQQQKHILQKNQQQLQEEQNVSTFEWERIGSDGECLCNKMGRDACCESCRRCSALIRVFRSFCWTPFSGSWQFLSGNNSSSDSGGSSSGGERSESRRCRRRRRGSNSSSVDSGCDGCGEGTVDSTNSRSRKSPRKGGSHATGAERTSRGRQDGLSESCRGGPSAERTSRGRPNGLSESSRGGPSVDSAKPRRRGYLLQLNYYTCSNNSSTSSGCGGRLSSVCQQRTGVQTPPGACTGSSSSSYGPSSAHIFTEGWYSTGSVGGYCIAADLRSTCKSVFCFFVVATRRNRSGNGGRDSSARASVAASASAKRERTETERNCRHHDYTESDGKVGVSSSLRSRRAGYNNDNNGRGESKKCCFGVGHFYAKSVKGWVATLKCMQGHLFYRTYYELKSGSWCSACLTAKLLSASAKRRALHRDRQVEAARQQRQQQLLKEAREDLAGTAARIPINLASGRPLPPAYVRSHGDGSATCSVGARAAAAAAAAAVGSHYRGVMPERVASEAAHPVEDDEEGALREQARRDVLLYNQSNRGSSRSIDTYSSMNATTETTEYDRVWASDGLADTHRGRCRSCNVAAQGDAAVSSAQRAEKALPSVDRESLLVSGAVESATVAPDIATGDGRDGEAEAARDVQAAAAAYDGGNDGITTVAEDAGRPDLTEEQALLVRRVLACRERSAWRILQARIPLSENVATPPRGSMMHRRARAAFRELALLVHPDKNPHPQAGEAMLLVTSAFNAVMRGPR